MFYFIMRYWRHHLVIIVLVLSWWALLQTALVTGDSPARYFEALYKATSLFLVGGLDIGFPHASNGLLNGFLWFSYFFAPLLTASFAYQFVQEKLLSKLMPFLNEHTIICGMGRNGKIIYDLVRQHTSKRHKIVIIEKNTQNAYCELLEKNRNTWWLRNDFTELPALTKAKVGKARHIIFSTNKDIANINGAVNVALLNIDTCRVICHLGDLSLNANLGQILLNEEQFASVKIFNAYMLVAKKLFHNWILGGDFLATQGNLIVILGYGRLGQMLLHQFAAREELKATCEYAIVDIGSNANIQRLDYSWHDPSSFSGCKIKSFFNTDVFSPQLWDNLAKMSNHTNKKMILFICRDNDVANLNLSISLKLEGPPAIKQSTIFCRIFNPMASGINEILEKRITRAQRQDIILFPLHEVLTEALRDELIQAE